MSRLWTLAVVGRTGIPWRWTVKVCRQVVGMGECHVRRTTLHVCVCALMRLVHQLHSNHTHASSVSFECLLSSGCLWSWGDNSCGKLGLGPNSDKSKNTPSKLDQLNGVRFVKVRCGSHTSVALTSEGQVFTW